MRIDASATAITWLPFDALDRISVVPLELAVAHYDEPPPELVPDLDELRQRDAFREANELRAWIDIKDGEIVDYGQTGRVMLTTLTKEFFMPRFQERDEGERESPYEKFPWDGVSGVRPYHGFAATTTVGVY